MADGYRLPLEVWSSSQYPIANILALHGFNDYRAAFAAPASYLAIHNVTTYAFDQRGFGDTQQRGIWAGSERMSNDAAEVARLLCAKHPDIPLYLMGESMGGAVVINLLQTLEDTSCVSGVILIAPAVWGWQTMPVWQRTALRLLAHSFPGYTPSGEGLDIVPSDNRAMLHKQWLDPLVIKETRIDSIYGLTNLMESALLVSNQINRPALILYGEKDEIIPANATCQMLNALPPQAVTDWRLVLYANGYHMLTRDLQAEVVHRDILSWLTDQQASLPSKEEVTMSSPRLDSVCAGDSA